ncbi:hypothetical protein [Vulgatibacter incomptus]|uniref:Lipoprotein n=1 Tax=Vulgatibacter incomptus TaxID=1391653 RepID=A0A0K1PHP0_9BACT|nr:hypothetical protein [Vulgatibacter incomptus]AKU92916.1 hypothetical protein AKJ08_3303 [Vulgatibacter incomptus]
MDRRVAPAVAAVLLATAAFVFGPAEGSARTADQAPLASKRFDDKLFLAMSIADEKGTVLAEPKLLGMCGVPLEMNLVEPGALEMPRVSLVLQPEWQRDGSYEIAFELSVPGRIDRGRGTMRLRPGEEKSAQVSYPGGHFDVQLAAFAVPSPEFKLYLEHGARQLIQASRT